MPNRKTGSSELISMTFLDEPRCRKNSFHSFQTIVRMSSITSWTSPKPRQRGRPVRLPSSSVFLHQRHEHIFQAGSFSANLLNFHSGADQQRNERRKRRVIFEFE